ncbi:tlde1 domain-containing protein [Vibrio cincinnatiensis]
MSKRMKLTFSITNQRLILTTPSYSFSIRATSGKGSCMNIATQACQMTPYRGAIPVGMYYLKPRELSNPNAIGDLIRTYRPDNPGDWGDWRIRIHAKPTTKTWGRDKFFIHGGSFDGSSGCIDIGGGLWGNAQTDRLASLISASKVNIYP